MNLYTKYADAVVLSNTVNKLSKMSPDNGIILTITKKVKYFSSLLNHLI